MSEVNILTEMGNVKKQILTDFLDYYNKEYTIPLEAFVKLPFDFQVGVILYYLYREYSILVMSDGVGNTIAYYEVNSREIRRHEYFEGGLKANYKVGIVRACLIIKERLE